MRSEIGKLDLDTTFREREAINSKILESVASATLPWGIRCLRYEIKDVKLGESMKKIMNLEAESERQKRAEIKVSEGKMTSEINIAEGHKRGKILEAQAVAEEIFLTGKAIAERIARLNQTITSKEGKAAAKYQLAELYIRALKNLAEHDKNLVIKANLNEPDEIIEKALKMMSNEKSVPDRINDIASKSENISGSKSL